MFNYDPYAVLNESDTADAFDSKQVEDVAKELTDAMDDIPATDEDETTNGGVPFTAEMCNLIESASFGSAKSPRYLLEMDVLCKLLEENEEEYTNPAEDDTDEKTPDVEKAVDDIADANSTEDAPIDASQIVVVGPSDYEVKKLEEAAKAESKAIKNGPNTKKMKSLLKAIKNLKGKGIKVVKKASPKKGKK